MKNQSLGEIASVFLKLGFTAFGGPAVHIAMMEKELVVKRKWISPEHFLDLVGATNLIPGPNSTELSMHLGSERGGWRGLIVAGLCFIVPAVLITAAIAWAYQQYGALPQVQPFTYGIKPAIIAVIVSLMISLGRKALKSIILIVISLTAALLVFAGISEIIVLFGCGFMGITIYLVQARQRAIMYHPFFLFMIGATSEISNSKIFFTFLKIGSILYGSGYVLFAFLEDEFVTTGLLSKQILIDAIAVGQFTPGPVFSSATFVGWQLSGPQGALLASVGIFLPSFLFVAFLNPIIPRLRGSKVMSAFLDSVNAASIAIILAVTFTLTQSVITDWRMILIAVASFVVTFYFKQLNTAFVIAGGALLGYALSFV